MYYLQSRYYDAAVGRFVNGDEVKLIFVNTHHNLFSYASNSPIKNHDTYGTFAVTFSLVGLFLLTFGTFITVTVLSDPKVQKALDDLIISIGKGISKVAEVLIGAIDSVIPKATEKPKNPKKEKHHIVAQSDKRAKKSRDLLDHKNVKINVNDEVNLVYINYNLHKHVHTTAYNDAVYNCLKKAKGSYNKTVEVLNFIKQTLLSASAMCM